MKTSRDQDLIYDIDIVTAGRNASLNPFIYALSIWAKHFLSTKILNIMCSSVLRFDDENNISDLKLLNGCRGILSNVSPPGLDFKHLLSPFRSIKRVWTKPVIH